MNNYRIPIVTTALVLAALLLAAVPGQAQLPKDIRWHFIGQQFAWSVREVMRISRTPGGARELR